MWIRKKEKKVQKNPLTERPNFQPNDYDVIWLSWTNRGNDTQLTPAVSIRQYRQRWIQYGFPPAPRTWDFWVDDLTQHLVTFDSTTQKEYNNVYWCVWESISVAIPDNVLTQVPLTIFDTNNYLMSSVSGQITIDRKGKYLLYAYAYFEPEIWNRRIQIRVNNVVVAENRVEWVPWVTVVDSWWDTVTIPPYVLQLNVSQTRLEYLNQNDIVTIYVRQDSGIPLAASVYLIAYNI